jgi:hypothetical protein
LSLPDTSARSTTRILAIYNLAGQLKVHRDCVRPLTDVFEMGRFAGHVQAAVRLLPQVAGHIGIDPALFHTSAERTTVGIHRLTASLATTARNDALLILDIDLEGEPTAEDVAELLYSTWHERSEMRVGDSPVMDWLSSRLGHVIAEMSEPLEFGRNVHQCVFAGGRLARRLLRANRASESASSEVIKIVFRSTIAARRRSRLDVRRPPALNNPGETMVAHGRGVSLIVGWAEPVENAFGIAAAGLVNAAGVVHRIRRQSLEALNINETATVTSTSELRALIIRLSSRLNDLQLDLSFGIETYADTVLMPELLIESYHASVRRVAALSESLMNTSRIVDRVAAVIESRRALLDASTAEYTEKRGRIFATSVAVGSLMALPPALLLAFFGINSTDVNDHSSIFNLSRYGVVYLAVWVPFIALVVVTAIMRRRVRLHMPDWVDGHSHLRAIRASAASKGNS